MTDSKFCVAMLQNHELWPLFQIGDRHFHHSPGSISVCIGEVEILDFSQLGHLGAWSRRKAMKRPHVTTGHWLEVPNMTSPNLWTLEMTPAFVVCCRSLKDEAWRQWCTILYTRSKTVDGRIPKQPPAMYNNEINYQAQLVNRISAINSIMPSFTYSYSTSSPLEWRILENHVDFQEVRVAKYCWCSCSEAPFVFKSMWNRNPSKRSASADVQPKINATEIGPEKSSGTKCTAPTVGNAVKLLTPADSWWLTVSHPLSRGNLVGIGRMCELKKIAVAKRGVV